MTNEEYFNTIQNNIYTNIISHRAQRKAKQSKETLKYTTLHHKIQIKFNGNLLYLHYHDVPVLSLLCQMSGPSSLKVLLLIQKITFSFFFNLFCHNYIQFYSFFYFFSSFLQSLGMFFLFFYHRFVFPSLSIKNGERNQIIKIDQIISK